MKDKTEGEHAARRASAAQLPGGLNRLTYLDVSG